MNRQRFDLVNILQEIFKKRLFVIGITIAALIVSVTFCMLRLKEYTAQTTFLVKNPLLIDRNYIFKNDNFNNGQFFAVPDDIDNIKIIAKSKGVLLYAIDKLDLATVYKTKDRNKLVEILKRNFKFIIEDTKSVELYYTDNNAERSALIVNTLREGIETAFLNYFISTNKDIMAALQHETNLLTDSIAMLNGSMEAIRSKIANYNQLLPVRGMYMGTSPGANTLENIKGIEQIHEMALLKDHLANDVASHKSLMNEYREIIANRIHAFYVVEEGYVPTAPSNPGIAIIVAASTIAALFFSCILVLINASYKKILSKSNIDYTLS